VVINEYLAWRRLRSASGQVGPVGDAEAFDHVEQLADRELADVEIATILGCRQATVRSISARALQLLRAHPMMAIVLEEA
jgi:phage shock protein A